MGIGEWFGFGKKNAPEPIIEVPAAPTSDSLLAALDAVEQQARDGVVPPMVMARLKRVTNIVRQTIPRLDSLGASQSAYNVMATATDYLPGAIGGYLRLPRDWADSRPVDRGKTSLLILIDQLDLLGATMDKVFDAVCRADAEALVVHGRFLQEKFGGPAGGGLAIDPATALPPMPAPAGATPPPDDPDTGDLPIVHRAPDNAPASTNPANSLELPAAPTQSGRLAPPIGRDS